MPKVITKNDDESPNRNSIFGKTRMDSFETPSLINLAHAPDSINNRANMSNNKFLTIIDENGTLTEQNPSYEIQIRDGAGMDDNSEYLDTIEQAEAVML